MAASHLHPHNEQLFKNNKMITCSEIFELPSSQQCAYVKEHCTLPEDVSGFISYLKLYYCSSARPMSLVIISTSLLISFVSLAHAASEFLCPNLYSISKLLALSDNLSGLTLLAFGNGSADIFSTYHALQSGSIELATSELISAALFILTVVVGLISIAKPFKVPKFFFLRDTIFYIFISIIVLIILLIGAIQYFTAVALLANYILYVVLAVYLHSYSTKFLRALSNIAQVRNSYAWQPSGHDTSHQTNYTHQLNQSNQIDHSESIIQSGNGDQSGNEFGMGIGVGVGGGSEFPTIDQLSQELNDEEEVLDDEFAEFLASHPHKSLEERIPIAAGSYALKLLLKQLMKHSSRLVTTKPQPIQLSPEPSPSHTTPTTVQSGGVEYVEDIRPNNRLNSAEQLLHIPEVIFRNRSFWSYLLPEFFPGQALIYKIYLVLITPANVLLKLTIPNRSACSQYCEKLGSFDEFALEPSPSLQANSHNPTHNYSHNHSHNQVHSQGSEDEDYDFFIDNLFFRTQIVASAFITLYVLNSVSYGLLYCGIILILACIAAYFLPDKSPEIDVNVKQHQRWNRFGSILGFCTSLIWISIFASEIVSALKAVGSILAIGDDKVGATLFAFGNSIGDLASNLSIARMGMPVMAFSACFGGPLLSICSLGLNAIIVMKRTNTSRIEIQFSNVLKVTLFALITTLLFLVVFIPRNNWMFDKKVGFILIFWWVTSMSLIMFL